MDTQRMLFAVPEPWSTADTVQALNLDPLVGLKWRLTKQTKLAAVGDLVDVIPDHKGILEVVEGETRYGKWLQDTPYFEHLFELVHEIYVRAEDKLPEVTEVVKELNRIRAQREAEKPLIT